MLVLQFFVGYSKFEACINDSLFIIFRIKLNRILKLFGKLLFNIPFAPYTMANVGSKVYKSFRIRHNFWLYSLFFFTVFLMFIILCFVGIFVSKDVWVIGLFSYLCFGACMAMIRRGARIQLKIEGSIVEDFVVSLFLYPCVAVQLELSTEPLTLDETEPSETEEERSLC